MAGIADKPTTRATSAATVAVTLDAPRGLREWNVRPRQVAILLWLRWTLGLRVYRRNLSSVLGAIAMGFFVLLIGLGGAFGTALGYLALSRAAATQLLFLTLGGLYLAWTALPLIQYTVNEGLDVTRLATYPLTRAERMIALTLATLFDPPTFIIGALFVAALVGWYAGPQSLAIDIPVLLLLYIHITGLSQMTVAALVSMLRSRRYRDISVIVFALISVTCSLSGQLFTLAIRDFHSIERLGQLDIGRYVQWLPPGMAAQAILAAHRGDAVGAVPWLAALLVLTPILLAAWAWTLDRGVTAPESAGSGRARRTRASDRARPVAAVATTTQTRRSWISPVVLAVAGKDLRYLWRDPQIKASLLSSLVLLLVVFAPNLVRSHDTTPVPSFFTDAFAGTQPMLAPIPALLIVLTLSMNALGLERQGLRTLMLFPTRSLDIFWGKNLAIGLIALIAQAAMVSISCLIIHSWAIWPVAFGGGLAGTFTLLGAGNASSALLPLRVRSLATGTSSVSSNNGCLRSVISLAALASTLVTLAPVFALMLGPLLLLHRSWFVVTVPLAVLYGFAVYQVATRLIAPWLDRHAPEIVARAVLDE
jgi:ABC-2 type transport system permease protein